MSCLNSLKGLRFEVCDTNLAGVKDVWLTDDENVEASGLSLETLSISYLSGATFYHFGMDEQQGYLTSTASVGDNGRLRYYVNEIRIAFPKLEETKHAEFMALTHNPVKAIVLDNNGKYHYVSYDQWLRANDGALAQTGQSYDDENGYEIVLSGRSAYPSVFITKAMADAVISEPDVEANNG